MVRSPSEYPWSSYRYLIGKDKKPKWLTVELVLEDFGGERKRGYRRYKEYVEREGSKELESPFRRAVASTFLGSEEFINNIRMEYLGKKKVDKRNIPAIKRVLRGPSPEEIEKAVAKVLGKDHTLYKKMCIYLSHQHSGMTLDEVGSYFGMRGSAVSQLSRRFKGALEGDKDLRGVLCKIKQEQLSNVET
jgi:hypothetical protein